MTFASNQMKVYAKLTLSWWNWFRTCKRRWI